MTRYRLASALVLATMLNGALAQTIPAPAPTAPQQNLSTNGPSGTYARTKTVKTLDAAGTVRSTTQSFDKSQSYTDGNGQLSAKTSIKSTGPATTVTTSGTPAP
jgi:hypothetical protein